MRLSKKNGFSLLETMIAMAVVAGLAAAVSTIFVHMREQMQLNQALRESESLRTYAQGILDQPALCAYALRGKNGSPIVWNPKVKNQPTVRVYQFRAGGVVAFAPPQEYARSSQLVDMYLREPMPYEGGISRSTLKVGATIYNTYSAKLVMLTQPRTGGSQLPISRTADVTLAFDSANTLRSCASASLATASAGLSNFVCQRDTLSAGFVDCKSDYFCTKVYYIKGFTPTGTPLCACMNSCYAGPEGPRGPGPSITVKCTNCSPLTPPRTPSCPTCGPGPSDGYTDSGGQSNSGYESNTNFGDGGGVGGKDNGGAGGGSTHGGAYGGMGDSNGGSNGSNGGEGDGGSGGSNGGGEGGGGEGGGGEGGGGSSGGGGRGGGDE